MNARRVAGRLGCVLMWALVACEAPAPNKAPAPQAADQNTTPPAPAQPAQPQDAPTALELKPRPALVALIEQARSQCQLSGAGSSPRGCRELDDKLDQEVQKLGVESLETLLWAVEHEHAQTRALGVWLIHANLIEPGLLQKLTPPERQALGEQLRPLSLHMLQRLKAQDSSELGTHLWAELAVDLAWITDQEEALKQTLSALKDEQTLANATIALMQQGRTRAFALVQRAAAPQESAAWLRRAALDAPLRMRDWTDQERALICPWYTTYLSDTSPEYTERPAQAMRRCGGPYLDKLIEELERRVEAKQFDRPFAFAIRNLLTERPTDKLLILSGAQLARIRARLEAAAAQESAPAAGRALAMSYLVQRWPDAQTAQLLERLSRTSADAKIAQEASRVMGLLKITQALKREAAP